MLISYIIIKIKECLCLTTNHCIPNAAHASQSQGKDAKPSNAWLASTVNQNLLQKSS